jgi:glycosyltransferase involved in cell wall biosynthesis
MYQNRKVCVVMPAYNSERTLERTYHDIPHDIVDDIILVDDCSRDNTVEVARSLGLHVVQHKRNLGYGGNQKTCYKEAVKRGADVVVMVHPDHQYDPTVIPHLLEKMAEENVQAVFGSRMMHRPSALNGGMPRWKFIANITLTKFANLMLGTNLTEYHSGFRAYDTKIFELIDIDKNSDNFVFDTHIIIQLADKKIKIAEVSIETRYFKEASQIGFWRSVRYGLGILKSITAYKLGIWRV